MHSITETLPSDIAPLLVLDASGRIRHTYRLWEQDRGGIKRLPSASKSYSNLSLKVLDKGAGRDSWQKNADQLVQEVASLIDSKPDEPWLVVHHEAAGMIDPKAKILSYIKTDRDRVEFLHWGAHQATNAYKDISNVIIAGTLFLPENHYLGLAYVASKLPMDADLRPEVLKSVRLGEHGHAIIQALCRASVRGSKGSACTPCNAYIITSKASGIREALETWFPECRVSDWTPRHKPLKGRVAEAVSYIARRLESDTDPTIMFSEIMQELGVVDRSNFNRRIRTHQDFERAVENLGLEENSTGRTRYADALRRAFLPDPEGTYMVDV